MTAAPAITPADASRAVLRAIRDGARTEGAIASVTGIGVSEVWRTVARGIAAGRLEWHREGREPPRLREVVR